jgi:hypothetical protein
VKRILWLITFGALLGHGQIVDDSTRQVYGPKTTKFTYSSNIVNDIDDYHRVDTTTYRFEKQGFVELNNYKFQNLGNFGTATFDSYFNPPELIGRTSGFIAHKPYLFHPEQIRYFDTKSPFIELLAYLGGNNRNLVDFSFSRNVNENWNFGFDLKIITADKQVAGTGRTDRHTVSNSYSVYTHYKHPKVPYQLLTSFSALSHKVNENGGVRFGADSLVSDFFQYRNALTRLDEAENFIQESAFYLFQDYAFAEEFKLYHQLDANREQNTFNDNQDGSAGAGYDTYRDFYPSFLIDADSTYERAQFQSTANEVGFKSQLGSVFLRGYARLRVVDFNYAFFDPVSPVFEEYLGGYARFDWRDKLSISANGEFLVGGEYQLRGDLKSKLINIDYLTMKYNVPFIYSNYFGNHFEWSNAFDPVFVNKVSGDFEVNSKRFEIRPKVSVTSYGGLLYFGRDREPTQANGTTLIGTAGGDFNIRLISKKGEGVHFENEVIASSVTGSSADDVRLPPILYNGRHYFKGDLFNDKVPVETGVAITARNAYFANAYDPVTQQFYVQDEQDIFGYWKTDLFFNMRLTNFFFSLKWNYFNQPDDGGYFSTPFYPSEESSIDLIIRWLFFD